MFNINHFHTGSRSRYGFRSPKAVMLLAAAVIMLLSGGIVRAASIEKHVRDGSEVYVLENEHLRLLVNPGSGGRGESLICKKTGSELVYTASRSESPQGSGLFLDRFWGAGQLRDFEVQRYVAEVTADTPAAVSLMLSVEDHGLRIEKTITLASGRYSIDVEYSITNVSDEDYIGRFWVVNAVYPERTRRLDFFYPYGKYLAAHAPRLIGEAQITRLSFPPGSGGCNYVNDPARGWGAALNDEGSGAVFIADYSFLERFYSYHPPTGLPPTFEWIHIPINLPPLERGKAEAEARPELEDPLEGYIFRTGFHMIPVNGMDTVTGAGGGIVCSIEPGEENVRVGLLSDDEREITAELYRHRLPGADDKDLLSVTGHKLEPGAARHFTTPAGYPRGGTYVYTLRAVSQADGREIASFEMPYVHIESSAEYAQSPAGEKSGLFMGEAEALALFTDFTEPCVEWAKPLAEPLKTLIVYTRDNHHEVAELTRRVDMDYTLMGIAQPHVWSNRFSAFNHDEMAEEALSGEYDLIIITGAIWWNIIPERFRVLILGHVEEGAGLFYVLPPVYDRMLEGKLGEIMEGRAGAADAPFLNRGIPLSVVPGLERRRSVSDVYELRRHGDGNIVFLRYNPVPYRGTIWRTSRAFTPVVEDDFDYEFPYWEFYYSLAARSMLYAAGREPKVTIKDAAYCEASESFLVEMENSTGAAAEFDITIEVRNRRWEEAGSVDERASVEGGGKTINIKAGDDIQTVLSGTYFFNVSARDGGAVLDWFSGSFDVIKPVHIERAELSKKTYSGDEPVSGRVFIVSKGDVSPGAYSLRYSVTDMHGRLLSHKEEEFGVDATGTIDFSINMDVAALSTLCEFRAELLSGGSLVDYRRLHFTTDRRGIDDMTFGVWGGLHGTAWSGRLAMRSLRDIGIDWWTGVHARSSSDEEQRNLAKNVLSSGMEIMPMAMHDVRVSRAKLEDIVRDPCLSRPGYIAGMRGDVLRYAGWVSDFHPPAYFVADENSLGYYGSPHDFCQSATCLARFRSYLGDKYGSIEGLNDAWQSGFGSWDEVVPYTLEQARESGNYAPWGEHRVFMFSVMSDTIAEMKRALLEVDPGGRLAISGQNIGSKYTGLDWYRLLQELDYTVAYSSPSLIDVIRSFRGEHGLAGSWIGYSHNYQSVRNKVWSEMFNEFFHFKYYSEFYHGAGSTFRDLVRQGDLRIAPGGEDLRSIISEVRGSGLGKLFMESEWTASPVAIHYSVPSHVASGFTGNYSAFNPGVFDANRNGWSLVIRDMGLQPPTYISSQQLETGVLCPDKHPVFILPLSQALSGMEAEHLERYVKAGGILVADAQAGSLKENCGIRSENILEKVFGISGMDALPSGGRSPVYFREETRLPVLPADAQVKVDGGMALGGAEREAGTVPVRMGGITIASRRAKAEPVPAFIVNRYGEGSGIYLNILLNNYSDMRRAGVESSVLASAILEALKEAGFEYDIDASLPPGTQMVRYTDGGDEYLGLMRLLRVSEDENRASISLNGARHIYELTEHKYLGRSDSIDMVLFPGDVRIFALTSARRGPVRLKTSKMPEGYIRYSVSVPGGIVRLEVYSGDDRKDSYSRNLKVEGGEYSGIIPLALNEREGVWRVKTTDIITGDSDEKTVRF